MQIEREQVALQIVGVLNINDSLVRGVGRLNRNELLLLVGPKWPLGFARDNTVIKSH